MHAMDMNCGHAHSGKMEKIDRIQNQLAWKTLRII